jgi:hypothetical protein
MLQPTGEDETEMKYQCIKCLVTWGEGNPEDDGYSHGLCLICVKEALAPLYRKRQIEEGNFDCFARSAGYCDQSACKYRGLCLDHVGVGAMGAP